MHCISAFVVQLQGNESIKGISAGDYKIVSDDTVNVSGNYVSLFTDYFGGSGEQSATLHSLLGDTYYTGTNSINNALNGIGVRSTKEHDEFDIIGLGNVRSNDDIDRLSTFGHKRVVTNTKDHEFSSVCLDTGGYVKDCEKVWEVTYCFADSKNIVDGYYFKHEHEADLFIKDKDEGVKND